MRAVELCNGLREAEGVLSDCLRYVDAGEFGGSTFALIDGAGRYVRALLAELSAVAEHEAYLAGRGMEVLE